MSPISLRSPPFPWHIPGLCWLPPCPLHPILWLGGSRRRSRLATKRVIPFLAADSRCLHPAFPHARSQCSKDPGAPLGHLRRYGVPAKKKKAFAGIPTTREECALFCLANMGSVARVPLGAGTSEPRLEQSRGWGAKEKQLGWRVNSLCSGPARGRRVALAITQKSRPSPPCSYRLRREGVCAPAPLGDVGDKRQFAP